MFSGARGAALTMALMDTQKTLRTYRRALRLQNKLIAADHARREAAWERARHSIARTLRAWPGASVQPYAIGDFWPGRDGFVLVVLQPDAANPGEIGGVIALAIDADGEPTTLGAPPPGAQLPLFAYCIRRSLYRLYEEATGRQPW